MKPVGQSQIELTEREVVTYSCRRRESMVRGTRSAGFCRRLQGVFRAVMRIFLSESMDFQFSAVVAVLVASQVHAKYYCSFGPASPRTL